MKKIKIKMICAIVLLVNVMPLHCMFRRVASWRPATSGMSREAAARLVAAQRQERSSLEQSVVEPKPDTSTWSGLFESGVNWFKSLLQRSPVESRIVQPISYAAARTVPFGARGYSTTQSYADKQKIDELFDFLNRYCHHHSIDTLPSQKYINQLVEYEYYGAFASTVNELVSLMDRTVYNPLNEDKGWPKPFFFRLLNMFFRTSVDYTGQIYKDTDELVLKIVDLGLHHSKKECLDAMQECGVDKLLRKKIDDMSMFTNISRFKDVQEFASVLLRWHNFLKGVDFDINSLSEKKINWEKVEQVCTFKFNNQQDYEQPMYNVKDNTDIFPILKEAGFTNISIGEKETTEQKEGFEDDSARFNIIRLLTLRPEASDKEILDAYNKFTRTARADVTKDITGPLYIKWQTEVKPAWEVHSQQLQRQQTVKE